jgi:predicted RNase H-like HicB family nuclease
MSYVVYREEEFFVAQCINVDVSSFGDTREAAVVNLKKAVELYFDGEPESPFSTVTDLNVGEEMVNV